MLLNLQHVDLYHDGLLATLSSLPDTGREAAPEPGRRRGQLEGKVTQPGPMARTVSKDQRLHSRLAFAPVFCRFIGRFVVRFFVGHKVGQIERTVAASAELSIG